MQLTKENAERLNFCANHGYTLEQFASTFNNTSKQGVCQESEPDIPEFVRAKPAKTFPMQTVPIHRMRTIYRNKLLIYFTRRSLLSVLVSVFSIATCLIASLYCHETTVFLLVLLSGLLCCVSAATSFAMLNRSIREQLLLERNVAWMISKTRPVTNRN